MPLVPPERSTPCWSFAIVQPWIWDASSGDVCSRLARHRSPVLDVASLQDGSSGKGLFAAVSQGEINVYQTLVFNT